MAKTPIAKKEKADADKALKKDAKTKILKTKGKDKLKEEREANRKI